MDSYNFSFGDKEYELLESNFDAIINDEEKPVEGIGRREVIRLMNQAEEVSFDVEYYDEPCFKCKAGIEKKAKYFKFLEYHFYLFTKDAKYVISSISKEYEDTSYTRLFKEGKVDNSYYASVIVCESCGFHSIEIEQCDI